MIQSHGGACAEVVKHSHFYTTESGDLHIFTLFVKNGHYSNRTFNCSLLIYVSIFIYIKLYYILMYLFIHIRSYYGS